MGVTEMNNTAFWLIIEAAVNREAALHKDLKIPFGSEDFPAIYGNVQFWRDKEGNWCYDKPTPQWDSAAITKDLQYWF